MGWLRAQGAARKVKSIADFSGCWDCHLYQLCSNLVPIRAMTRARGAL